MRNSVKNGTNGGFRSFSQFHIVHTYNSHHTKEEPWNSLMKAAAPRYRQVSKTTAFTPSLTSILVFIYF